MEDLVYPSEDGEPMADDMWQGDAMLNAFFDIGAAHPGALVAAAILVYPEEGNVDNRISPDVLVAFGLGTHNRGAYMVWEEGKPPDWVLEVATPRSEAADRGYKWNYYAAMGIPEYWLFDAKGDVYPPGTPRLQGLGLVDGEYRPLASRLVDGELVIRSEVLGLDVLVDGDLLRFREPATGEDILHPLEIEAAITKDQRRAAEARAARIAAEARAERIAAETAKIRAERIALERKAERIAAETRAHREAIADAEARTVAAEARIAELEAALRPSQSDPAALSGR